VSKPLVSIITATTGNPLLEKCVRSVLNQSYDRIQHLVIADGPETHIKVTGILEPLRNPNLDVVYLPYSIGKDRWNGHRIYGSGTFISEGQFLIYLDDDNALHPDHTKNCLEVIENGKQWSYSFRNIVDENHNFICRDNCESLGRWNSIINPNDFFIDVNCYFLPRNLALSIVPVWWRKFREPGQPEIDRAMIALLNRIAPNFDSTYKYTVDYKVGNSQFSVQSDFFIKGNEAMLKAHNGKLPWVKE